MKFIKVGRYDGDTIQTDFDDCEVIVCGLYEDHDGKHRIKLLHVCKEVKRDHEGIQILVPEYLESFVNSRHHVVWIYNKKDATADAIVKNLNDQYEKTGLRTDIKVAGLARPG